MSQSESAKSNAADQGGASQQSSSADSVTEEESDHTEYVGNLAYSGSQKRLHVVVRNLGGEELWHSSEEAFQDCFNLRVWIASVYTLDQFKFDLYAAANGRRLEKGVLLNELEKSGYDESVCHIVIIHYQEPDMDLFTRRYVPSVCDQCHHHAWVRCACQCHAQAYSTLLMQRGVPVQWVCPQCCNTRQLGTSFH